MNKDIITDDMRYAYVEYDNVLQTLRGDYVTLNISSCTASSIHALCMENPPLNLITFMLQKHGLSRASLWTIILNTVSIDKLIYIYEHCHAQCEDLENIFAVAYKYRRHDIINKFARYLTAMSYDDRHRIFSSFYVVCHDKKLLHKHVDAIISIMNNHVGHASYVRFIKSMVRNLHCDDNLIIYVLNAVLIQQHNPDVILFTELLQWIYKYRSHALFLHMIKIIRGHNCNMPNVIETIYNDITYITCEKSLKYALDFVEHTTVKDFMFVMKPQQKLPSNLLLIISRYKHSVFTYEQTHQLLNVGRIALNHYATLLLEKHKQRLFIFAKIINDYLTYNLSGYDTNITKIMQDYVYYESDV